MQPFDFANAPGHLIRRAHQTSVALFMAESRHDITQVQFALLNALIQTPGCDQVTLAQRVALDPATSGAVVGRLEARGWVRRSRDATDKRRRLLWITEAGEQVVAELKDPIARSQARLLSPLTEDESSQLRRLLGKLVAGQVDKPV